MSIWKIWKYLKNVLFYDFHQKFGEKLFINIIQYIMYTETDSKMFSLYFLNFFFCQMKIIVAYHT